MRGTPTRKVLIEGNCEAVFIVCTLNDEVLHSKSEPSDRFENEGSRSRMRCGNGVKSRVDN